MSKRRKFSAEFKRAHQGAGHDQWFRSKVSDTLDRLERGEETLLPHKEAFAQLRSDAA